MNFGPDTISPSVLIPKVAAEGTDCQHRRTNFALNALCSEAAAWDLFIITVCLSVRAAMSRSACCILLLLPGLLLSCARLVGADGFSLTPIELSPIPCNDKTVGKLSRLAITYLNEDRPDGYKFALNRVANVHLHAQVGTAPAAGSQTPQAAWGSCHPASAGLCPIFIRGGAAEGLFSPRFPGEISKQLCGETEVWWMRWI